MSEPELAPKDTDSLAKVEDEAELDAAGVPEPDGEEGAANDDAGEELDAEAQDLLKELESSQAEVERLLGEQRLQAAELGGLKDNLAAELHQLQDEAWKLQVYSELEMLKHQLAAISGIGADLDQLEKKMQELDEEEESTLQDQAEALGADGTDPPAAEGLGDDLQGIEALQNDLDQELAAMQKQLDAIKAESAAVTRRKAQLEAELYQLLHEGVTDMGEQLAAMGLEGPEGEAAANGEVAAASPAQVAAAP